MNEASRPKPGTGSPDPADVARSIPNREPSPDDIRDHSDAEPDYEINVDADLVVVGGGLAGLCMAIAAAREQCRTVLVHNRPVLGGNSSSESRVVPAGASHHSAWARETGLIEEILLADRAANHTQFWENGLTNSLYDLVLYTMARRERCLILLLNTHVDRAEVRADQKIEAAQAVQLSTGRRIRLTGGQFADCTGDGVLSRLAGADCDYGREGREEYGEPLAPVKRDRVTSGSTISIKARDIGTPVPFVAPDWAVPYRIPEDLGPFRQLRNVDSAEFGGFWWFEIGYPFHQITGAEEVRDMLYRHILGVWDYLKNHHPQHERFAGYALEWVGSVVAKRESARVLGDVVLTESDCHAGRLWPDRIASAGWYLDLHTKYGLLDISVPGEPSQADPNYRAWVRVPPFSVPLRSCYSRNIGNLWLGGRLISATHVANGALRVQQTLAQIGQATGIAAAYTLANGLVPRQAIEPEHIRRIQQRALYLDVRIPGLRLSLPRDLARSATVSASSDAPLDLTELNPSESRPLGEPRAQALPLSTTWIAEIAIHLSSTSITTVPLAWRVERCDTLWQRGPGVTVAEGQHMLPPAHHGWLSLDVGTTVRPGTLHRLVVSGSQEVTWTACARQPAGTVALRLHDSREHRGATVPVGLPDFTHWCQDKWIVLATRISPEQRPYGPGNVVTGQPHPEAWTNLWASDPAQNLPQWLELNWQSPVRPRRLSLWFDTNLNAKLGLAPALWKAPECARDYIVSGRCGPGAPLRTVADVRGNHQRLNRLELPGEPVTTLRIEVTANNEEPLTGIRRQHLRHWQRDGQQELHDMMPRGARIYQIVVEGEAQTPKPRGPLAGAVAADVKMQMQVM